MTKMTTWTSTRATAARVFALVMGATLLAVDSGVAAEESSFAGSRSCAQCHEQVFREWSGSHHDLAMQEATSATILGDFDDVTFSAYGVTSRFFKKDEDFFVNTEGSDGTLRDYEIDYAFGVYPLQQYLVAFPGGRYQVLGLAWDARRDEPRARRWFHMYPDEHIAPGDVLHWTGLNQNWNYMCADCHTTNLRRNFDRGSDTYRTTWSELGVACEACHGPGSRHVAWARPGNAALATRDPSRGLSLDFNERSDVQWTLKEGAITASRSTPPPTFRMEVETCGRCHARRSPLGDAVAFDKPLLDSYRLALLTEDLYHVDGQIKDEVYVFGSYLQSKMYRAGVTCSDCHDPHSLKLRAEGNALCTRCHLSEAFATPAHHFHTTGEAGSRCVDCHAPETTYMVVDPRRDHSFRVPRPDLSVKLGVPNACSGCHVDKSARWAADKVAEWHGTARQQSTHFGEALAGVRNGVPGADGPLIRIARDTDQSAMVRATALETLGRNLNRETFAAVGEGLRDDNALVRLAALGALEPLAPRDRFRAVFPLAQDPVRAVRLEAARLLAPVPLEALPEDSRKVLATAFGEFEKTHNAIADRPESLMTLGNFYRDRGDATRSEAAYREATTRHPTFGPAYVNLADLYRSLGRNREEEDVMRAALEKAPEQAGVLHAYGLLLIRKQRYQQATEHLGRATELEPDNARYSYVYALALQKIGDTSRALTFLSAAHDRHPGNRDILIALATMSRDRGDLRNALKYAEALLALSPSDPAARQLLESLQSQLP